MQFKSGRRDRCERLGVQAGTDQRAGRHWWRELRLSAAESCLQATAPTSASTGPSASQSRSVFPQNQNMFFFQFESILKCYGKSIWEITQQMLLETNKLLLLASTGPSACQCRSGYAMHKLKRWFLKLKAHWNAIAKVKVKDNTPYAFKKTNKPLLLASTGPSASHKLKW